LGSASRPRRGIKARFVATALVTLILAGCAVGPNYKRPPIVPPEETRGQIGAQAYFELLDRELEIARTGHRSSSPRPIGRTGGSSGG
jgi:hypothetical protein